MKNRLKELRRGKGISQLKLQMHTGIEQALLSKYENDVRVPSVETLVILADYYGVSIDYILYRSDVPEVNKEK